MSAASPAARELVAPLWRRLLEHYRSLARVRLDEPGEILVSRFVKAAHMPMRRKASNHPRRPQLQWVNRTGDLQ